MPATDRKELTEARIKALPIPELPTVRPIHFDGKVQGFGVRVTHNGAKSYVLYRKLNGRAQILTIGKVGAIPLAEARGIAVEWNGDIARGNDPQTEKRKAREEMTLGKLWSYFAEHRGKRNRTWNELESKYTRFLERWANRRLSDISRADVQGLHAKIGKENGRYQANRVLALLHVLFRKAQSWGFLNGENPATGIDRFKEEKRERFLQPGEAEQFFKALDQAESDLRDFVMLALLTGARKSNVLAMRWDELDLSAGVWTIPRTKNDSPLQVPLVPQAMAILEGRKREAADKAEWIFPAETESGHWEFPDKAWRAFRDKAGVPDLHIHDLRRTMGSWTTMAGANVQTVGKVL